MSKRARKTRHNKKHPTVDDEDQKDFIRRHCQARLRVTFDLSAGTLAGDRRTPLDYESGTAADALKVQLDNLIALAIAEERLTLASLGLALPPRANVEIDA